MYLNIFLKTTFSRIDLIYDWIKLVLLRSLFLGEKYLNSVQVYFCFVLFSLWIEKALIVGGHDYHCKSCFRLHKRVFLKADGQKFLWLNIVEKYKYGNIFFFSKTSNIHFKESEKSWILNFRCWERTARWVSNQMLISLGMAGLFISFLLINLWWVEMAGLICIWLLKIRRRVFFRIFKEFATVNNRINNRRIALHLDFAGS